MAAGGASLGRQQVVRLFIPIFLASGAASLVYETLWARQLHVLFGTSQLAITTVLAAFMGGLALGAFAAARWAGRFTRPLLVYAVLEAFIGAYALAFPWLLRAAEPFYLGVWRAVEPGPSAFGLFQFVLLGIMLLPPTFCMGATLPLLARFVTGERSQAGFQIGRLYGVNTLGAVLGTFLAGFVLLPRLGLATTTWWTAAVNGLLALAAVWLSRQGGAIPPAVPEPVEKVRPSGDWSFDVLLIVAALAGFASLLCEVAWFRLLALVLGASTYAFTIMLLGFLLGIGIGGWVAGGAADRSLARGGRALVLRNVALIQLGVAGLSWAAMFFYGQLPFAFVWLYDKTADSSWMLWPAQLLLALAIMILPTLLMGATFPFLVRAAAGSVEKLNRPVGRLYGMNTVGALLGAALGGLVLLPLIHIRGTVLLAVAINIVAALGARAAGLAASGAASRGRFMRWAVAAAAMVAIIGVVRPPWDPLLMSSGMYKYASDLTDRTRQGVINYAVAPFDLLYYNEGPSSVITVARTAATGNIWLANNGKVDASSQNDLATQLLVAHLPFFIRPDLESVLVIGLASGISAGAVAMHPGPERIDVVEIEPAAVAASHHFDEHNNRPLEDPRVNLIINDARNHLMLVPDGTYDMVNAEPSNPWISGVSNLFTKEFFTLGKRKMAPGGIWAQWVQMYGMTPPDLRSVLITFADVYQHMSVFRVDSSDLVILGSDAPIDVSASDIFDNIGPNLPVVQSLASVDVETTEDLVALFLLDRDAVVRLAGDSERNTDDNMLIEYSAPFHLHEETRADNAEMLLGVAPVRVDAVEGREGLLKLAMSYAKFDWDYRRALRTVEIAADRYPGDEDVEAVFLEIQELVSE